MLEKPPDEMLAAVQADLRRIEHRERLIAGCAWVAMVIGAVGWNDGGPILFLPGAYVMIVWALSWLAMRKARRDLAAGVFQVVHAEGWRTRDSWSYALFPVSSSSADEPAATEPRWVLRIKSPVIQRRRLVEADAWVCGSIRPGSGTVALVSDTGQIMGCGTIAPETRASLAWRNHSRYR